MHPGAIRIHSFKKGGDVEKAHVDYLGDPHLYDSSIKVTVVYRRSKDWRTNGDRTRALNAILRKKLPSIPKFYPTVTCLTLECVHGRPTSAPSITEDMAEIINYITVPSRLSQILTVQISELYKVTSLSMEVDQVKWKDQTWAFKFSDHNPKGNLQEISILDRLSHSPSIIQLKAIVIDQHNGIRGFLTPFMPRGDLADVLEMRQTEQGLTNDDGSTITLDWSVKLSWARQITGGVADLHAISAYNGDIKPSNVLIDETGQAVLIDFCPMGVTDGFAAPELLAIINDPEIENKFTAMADMYSLGVTLYALAEETSNVEMPLVWRNEETPEWYRDAVQQCLAVDCRSRPTAVEMLHSLGAE